MRVPSQIVFVIKFFLVTYQIIFMMSVGFIIFYWKVGNVMKLAGSERPIPWSDKKYLKFDDSLEKAEL